MVEQITDKLGRPIRDLRLSVTDRCNFRCDYCMPKEIFGDDFELKLPLFRKTNDFTGENGN